MSAMESPACHSGSSPPPSIHLAGMASKPGEASPAGGSPFLEPLGGTVQTQAPVWPHGSPHSEAFALKADFVPNPDA